MDRICKSLKEDFGVIREIACAIRKECSMLDEWRE
jgi:hypothetical protein